MALVNGSSQLAGGLSEEKMPTETVRGLLTSLHGAIEKTSNKQLQFVEPLSYRVQVAAGLNYFVKVS